MFKYLGRESEKYGLRYRITLNCNSGELLRKCCSEKTWTFSREICEFYAYQPAFAASADRVVRKRSIMLNAPEIGEIIPLETGRESGLFYARNSAGNP
ncbi:hypothetical protein WCU37_16030 [Serratia marcescens]|uniref:hypothetical protein n=1 Tax=Serratia marcescens TaxID=615 RepID=UPI0030D4F577